MVVTMGLTLFNTPRHFLSSPLSQRRVNQTSHQHPTQTVFVEVLHDSCAAKPPLTLPLSGTWWQQ